MSGELPEGWVLAPEWPPVVCDQARYVPGGRLGTAGWGVTHCGKVAVYMNVALREGRCEEHKPA